MHATRWVNGRNNGPSFLAESKVMILILSSDTDQQGADFRQLMDRLAALPGIKARV